MSHFGSGPRGSGGFRAGGSGGPQGHRGIAASPNDRVSHHWPDYLKNGYFDQDGFLRSEYVSREKVEPLVQAMCSDRGGLTTRQVRRYFGHCRAIETRLKTSSAKWLEVWPDVKKLDIAAAHGAAKHPPKIPALFHDFIRSNVASIKSKKDFLKGFLPHFEALIGFGQAHFRRERT